MAYTLGVASSVASKQQFDVQIALDYVIEQRFGGFQAYMNDQLLTHSHLRDTVQRICTNAGLDLLVHAPATLSMNNLAAFPANEAIRHLFHTGQKPLVVHHYDETVPMEESFACLQMIQQAGQIACLENFFMRGAETAEICFSHYLQLLHQAHDAGISVIPVFDIPRLYHAPLRLTQKRIRFWIDEAIDTFASFGTPIILHLIDVRDAAQSRADWCPIGTGFIPYGEIFNHFKEKKIQISQVILEYEDMCNPIESKAFLAQHLGHPNPQTPDRS